MRRMLMALLVGCGLPVSPAAAQFKTDDPDTEILVQGIRERDQEIASFVKALTFTPVQGTISRFEWEVCPAVLGLTPELNARIANRMRAVASAANIPLAQANCTPNALVLLTRDKPRLLKQLEREAPGIYPDWSVARMRQAIADPSPVAAWQLNGLLSADGSPYSYNYAGYAIHRSSRFPTRIVPGARRQLEVSVVVIDKSALVGLSPTQLADYAAMRSFVRTDPAKLADSPAPSILKIIDAPPDAAVPVTLTQWDLSFLKGVYASTANAWSASQRSEIQKSMGRDLGPGDARHE